MAALIADTCGAVCSGICTLPCTLCSGACKGLCQGCSGLCKGCGSLCKGCTRGCGECCAALNKALCSPFAPYLIVTAVLNLPVALWGFRKALDNEGASCAQQSLWLWINGGIALLHVVAAVYIVIRVQNHMGNTSTAPTTATATAVPAGNNEESKNSLRSFVQVIGLRAASESGRSRFRKVLCYDPVVALYMLASTAWLGWVFYGMVTLAGAAGGDCEDSNVIMSSIMCGLLFVLLACCTIPCAFLCLD